MATKKRSAGARAGKATRPPSRGPAGKGGPSKPARRWEETAATTTPLVSLTHGCFDALRARVESPSDAEAVGSTKEHKKAGQLSDALKRLEADYDRVLKRE